MKILVGISGGVDSAYAVKRLVDMGHSVEGAILKMHEYTELAEAEARAAALGIPLHILDLTEKFSGIVKENLIEEYLHGRTPTPCIVCNEKIKFPALYDFAMTHGFDAIATGHYARIVRTDGTEYVNYAPGDEIPEGERVAVAAAADSKKDQSYMLYRLPENILRRLYLPLSDCIKETVKLEAEKIGIVPERLSESQEICFIKEGSYADFIESRRGISQKGKFVSDDGTVLGEHNGIIRYTVGQRKGLGVSAASRIFVTKIDVEKNEITLSPSDSFSSVVYVKSAVLPRRIQLQDAPPRRLSVKLRYAQKASPATVEFLPDRIKINLDSPLRAVTPGQSAVLYDGDVVFGGGIIEYAE